MYYCGALRPRRENGELTGDRVEPMLSQVGADSIVAGRYTLERCINTGGIGSLWLARDEQTGRSCAMRLADGTGHNVFELAARYRAEVDIIERIRCENVLDILDYGDWNEMPYLVVEHLEGEDLAARLRREGRLLPELAYRLLAQAARALARAHAVGIVHGDVTPEHILIAEEGMQSVAKVYNFSLTQRGAEINVGTVTKIGTFLRLPHYSSPEQVAGKAIDWRSDLWSLGVLCYECLTGKKPFDSNVFGDLVAQILCDPVPELKLPEGETPAAIRLWWQKACTRDPDKRFQSAKELSDALGQAFELPIVFVPDGAFGAGAAAAASSMPVPNTPDESRVKIRSKSKSRIARLKAQIGLAGRASKSPPPVPAVDEPSKPAVDEPSKPAVDEPSKPAVEEHTGTGVQEPPKPAVLEPSFIEAPSHAPGPEESDLADDLFADFQAAEAPTFSLRQVGSLGTVDDEFNPDRVAEQLKRRKSLRKMVFGVLAALVAIIALPLMGTSLASKHKKAAAPTPVVSTPSNVAQSQAQDIASTASHEFTVSAAAASPDRASDIPPRPSAESRPSAAVAAPDRASDIPPPLSAEPRPSALAAAPEAASDTQNARSVEPAPSGAAHSKAPRAKAAVAPRTRKAVAPASGPVASPQSNGVSEPPTSVAPKPSRPKAQTATRDYGI